MIFRATPQHLNILPTPIHNHQFPLFNIIISITARTIKHACVTSPKTNFLAIIFFVKEKYNYKETKVEMRTSLPPLSWKMTTRPPRSPTAKWSPFLSNSIAEITSTESKRNVNFIKGVKFEEWKLRRRRNYCLERLLLVVYRRRPERTSSPKRRPATKKKNPSSNSCS